MVNQAKTLHTEVINAVDPARIVARKGTQFKWVTETTHKIWVSGISSKMSIKITTNYDLLHHETNQIYPHSGPAQWT